MKNITIIHEYNKEYNEQSNEGGAYSEVTVLLDGSRIWRQDASESLHECPEDVAFHRDLNDPADVISLIKKLVGDDTNYKLTFEDKQVE